MKQGTAIQTDISYTQTLILKSLGLNSNQIIPQSITKSGRSFVLIPVKDKSGIQQLKPDIKLIKKISEVLSVKGYYVFFLDKAKNKVTASRLYTPGCRLCEEFQTRLLKSTNSLTLSPEKHYSSKKNKISTLQLV